VADRSCQLDVAHPLPAHAASSDLHPAPVADHALVFDLLVAATVALPVLYRAKDPLAEKPVPLWLESPIVDGFRLFDLTKRPVANILGGSYPDPDDFNTIESADGFGHLVLP